MDIRLKRFVKKAGIRATIAIGMQQLALTGFSRPHIQPTHPLPTGMKITPYYHLRLLLSPASLVSQA
jgi:hypothetical protein